MTVRTGFGNQPATPKINQALCQKCGLCTRVCKTGTLMLENGSVKIHSESPIGCFGCGQCMMVCPESCIQVTGRKMDARDLINLPKYPGYATYDQLQSLLLQRRSTRNFAKREVETGTLDAILESISTAPMGIPPSDVGVVIFQGADKVKAFSEDIIHLFERQLPKMKPAMLKLMKPLIGKEMVEFIESFVVPAGVEMVKSWKEGRDELLYGAPCAMLFHHSPYADPADSTIAATYAMLAAHSLGLGSCMIGMVSPMMQRDKQLMDKYQIPKGNKLGIVLIMGYPKFPYQHTIRRKLASITAI